MTFQKYLYQAHADKPAAQAWQWYETFVNEEALNKEKQQGFFRQINSWLFLGSERFVQQGKAVYQESLKSLQTRGVSWIEMVRNYSQLFRPMAQVASD